MLIYKQRYKPRTTREFTKNDLTVYDSAGNTALNALTVYGKSEVVDSAIKSAGEGYAVVDLGTLNWTKGNATSGYFYSSVSGIKQVLQAGVLPNWICSKYNITTSRANQFWELTTENKVIGARQTTEYVCIVDNDYATADAATFKNAMSGVILAYEEATPTNNAIAIKTDDGSDINGTMAVFTTGTPLRGIPDTTVRDVMTWYDSSGEVTKNCGKVRLADLTWQYYSQYNSFVTDSISDKQPVDTSDYSKGILCNKYPAYNAWWTENTKPDKTISCTANVGIAIKDTDYTTVSDFVASLGNAELVYELATPTTEQLTSTENASIAGLRTFEPQTHAQNNAQTEMTVDYTIRVPTI